jgi:hypothetical protein
VPHRPQGLWAWTGAVALAGLALAGSAVLSRPPADAAGTVVQVTPAHVDIGVDETGDVSIAIVDATDLYGASIVVGFNPAVAEVVDVDPLLGGVQIFPGSFPGPSEQPGSVVINSADNLAGTIAYEFTLLTPAVPVSGSGTLATIRFVGKAPGATSILIQSGTLSDQFGDPISVTFFDGTVSVSAPPQPTATPTATPTQAPTGTPTPTPSPTPSATPSPTSTPSATATAPTGTPTLPSDGSPTPTATGTPAAPTATVAATSEPSTAAPAVVLVPGQPTATAALVQANPQPPQAPLDPGGATGTPSSSEAGLSGLPAAGNGGQGPLVPWRPLVAAAVIVLAGGGSWAFYYLTRGATPSG